MNGIRKIILIGAGNVATHLGLALKEAGMQIQQVYSRTEDSASLLAGKLDCRYTTSLQEILPGADLYLFALSDDALEDVLARFPHKQVFVTHTSGSINMDVLKNAGLQSGVFYPLQTFSKAVKVDWADIPICIEAHSEEHEEMLRQLALKISKKVIHMDSQQRETLHLAAVFACNFTNHMLAIAHDILQNEHIPTDILHPLVKETIRKALENNPAAVQTGPAARNNKKIMDKHIQRLVQLPAYRKIYIFASESISGTKNQKPSPDVQL
jgi:predicted short-subunit dehydrogenase-like oxidoreductase (DUF2520 family)